MLLCCFSSVTEAQTQNRILLRGVVTSASDGYSLPGAHVIVQNKDGRVIAATATDMDGNYSLMIDGRTDNKMIVSFAGYKKETINLGKETVVNVAMKDDVVVLKGAVVTADRKVSNGMMNISEREMSIAAKRIDMSEIQELGGASVDDALQGRIAGMDIQGREQ